MAVQEARTGSDVAVHVGDVNILRLLMHHCKDVLGEMFFQTFKKTNESRQIWRVKDVNENVDECILNNVLFYTPEVGATHHLKSMDWVKFQVRTVVRE